MEQNETTRWVLPWSSRELTAVELTEVSGTWYSGSSAVTAGAEYSAQSGGGVNNNAQTVGQGGYTVQIYDGVGGYALAYNPSNGNFAPSTFNSSIPWTSWSQYYNS